MGGTDDDVMCAFIVPPCSLVQPFKLRFESFSHFHRSSSNTLWLKPVTEVRAHALKRRHRKRSTAH
jgi:hypothetical protein